jgi:hypothetical protein
VRHSAAGFLKNTLMDNLDFLKQILTSGCEYWIAAKKESEMVYGSLKRQPDSIWVIAIPMEENLHIPKKEEEILLRDIERLRSLPVHNIAISENYPPFQHGQTLYNFYLGFPIKENIKQFVIKALQLGSSIIYDYVPLLEETKPELTTQ